jgi:protocatechuate 3,4-dioxygenase beta subunit
VAGVFVVALGKLAGGFDFNKYWTSTGEDGSFQFTDLPPDRYSLLARKEGLPVSGAGPVRVPGAGEIRIVIQEGFPLAGRILDGHTNGPVTGARVMAMGEGGAGLGQGVSDGGGEYRIDGLAPGTYRIWVSAPGYLLRKDKVRGEAGESVERDFLLERGITLSGRVLDAKTLKPLAKVRVLAIGLSEALAFGGGIVETETALDGTFTLKGAPFARSRGRSGRPAQGKRKVQLAAVGNEPYQGKLSMLEVPAGLDVLEGIEILLEVTPRVRGRIVDAWGAPVVGAKITVVSPTAQGLLLKRFLGEKPQTFVSGEGGRFQADLEAGKGICLWVRHPAYTFGMHKFDTVAPGEVVEDLTIKMSFGGMIEGLVLDEGGAPLVGGRIVYAYAGQVGMDLMHMLHHPEVFAFFKKVVTDEEGKFVLPQLRPGEWKVSILDRTGRKHGKTVRVADGETVNVRIQKVPTLSVRGVVVDEAGNPLEGATVIATAVQGEGRGSARSGRNGNFLMEGLDPGTYRFKAFCGGCLPPGPRDGVLANAGGTSVRIVLKKR